MFFCFLPGISLSAKGCPTPKGARKDVFRDFPPVGVRSTEKQNVKKLRNFLGEIFWGRRILFPNVPLGPGNRVFPIWPEISLSAKGCPRPKGPTKPVFRDFPTLGVRTTKTQNVKKLRSFWDKFLGGRIFFPNVPLGPGNRVFRFWPEISSSAQGGPRPKGPTNPVFREFPTLGVRMTKTQNVKKLRNFWEKLMGQTDFPPKSALRYGKSCFFPFLTWARNFSKCPRPKTGQKPSKSPLATTWGSEPKKMFMPKKLRKTIPGTVVTFFPLDFGTPSPLGSRKGPAELVTCCLLLVACCLLAC